MTCINFTAAGLQRPDAWQSVVTACGTACSSREPARNTQQDEHEHQDHAAGGPPPHPPLDDGHLSRAFGIPSGRFLTEPRPDPWFRAYRVRGGAVGSRGRDDWDDPNVFFEGSASAATDPATVASTVRSHPCSSLARMGSAAASAASTIARPRSITSPSARSYQDRSGAGPAKEGAAAPGSPLAAALSLSEIAPT